MISVKSDHQSVCTPWLIPLGAIALMMWLCIFHSATEPFWFDELASVYMVSDSSLHNMLAAFCDHTNHMPPLYFILGFGWCKLFGVSELSIRMLSSLGMSTAFVVVWALLRRVYGTLPATVAAIVVFFFSLTLQYQNTQASPLRPAGRLRSRYCAWRIWHIVMARQRFHGGCFSPMRPRMPR